MLNKVLYKEIILGTMSYPMQDKLIVTVTRGDERHIPHTRTYIAKYEDLDRVCSLAYWFGVLNTKVVLRMVALRRLQNGNQD